MIRLVWDNNFEKKLKKYIDKHPDKKKKINDTLVLFQSEPFSRKLRNHKLSGILKDLRAIIVDYDCRIVFRFIKKGEALLVDIGTHEEVY